jgi:hypothetical protein
MAHSGSRIDKFSALKGLGVGEFAHLNGDLESHLSGTYALLARWGNPVHVCDAGLYHAVYGTQPMERLGLPHKAYSPSDRPGIREIIGAEAERLVYTYGACDRDFLYPQLGSPNPIYRDRFSGRHLELPARMLSELLEITLANELEICISGPSLKEKHREGNMWLFGRCQGLVSENAFACYREVFEA